MADREHMTFDILIIGGGPAGLSAAIRIAQKMQDQPPSIAIIDKGSDIGSHTLSGALLDTSTLNQLIPNWQELDMPTHGEVTAEQFCYLSAKKSWRLPIPKALKNKAKTPIISITHFCRWLADYASSLGIEIFPGFAASQLIFNDNNEVCGVQTGDMGIDKNHQPTDRFQAGMNLLAPTTLLAEGCHGSLSEQVIKHYQLRSNQPQTYGLGIREVWQVQNTTLYQPGTVVHTLGWPLPDENYGGGFIYHLNQQQVAIGFVVGLDYQNPTTNPHQIMQQFKNTPKHCTTFKRWHPTTLWGQKFG